MIKIAKGREETRPMLSDMDLEDLGKVKGWHPREGIVSQRQTKPGVVLGVVTTHFIKI